MTRNDPIRSFGGHHREKVPAPIDRIARAYAVMDANARAARDAGDPYGADYCEREARRLKRALAEG